MGDDDLNSAIKRSRAAVAAIFSGNRENREPAKTLFSDEDDINLGNPFGPVARRRRKVVEAFTAAATNYGDGEVTAVEAISNGGIVKKVKRRRAKNRVT